MHPRLRFHCPHSMRPDLKPLPEGEPLIDWGLDWGAALEDKVRAAKAGTSIHVLNAPENLVEAMVVRLAAYSGNRLQVQLDVTQNLNGLKCSFLPNLSLVKRNQHWEASEGDEQLRVLVNGFPDGQRLWAALGFMVHEDLAAMVWDDSQGLSAQALHVSFPSGWSPKDKLGKNFHTIHTPVADAQLLLKASKAIGQTIIERGPFERFVWTISASSERSQLPGGEAKTKPSAVHASNLFLRYERQLTLPMPARHSALFLIRVYLAPLAGVLSNAEHKQAILASLASMTETVIEYKGLAAIREQLLGKT